MRTISDRESINKIQSGRSAGSLDCMNDVAETPIMDLPVKIKLRSGRSDDMKLTPKQELYALGLSEGKSQRRAYIDAGYSTENKSDRYIDVRAYELSKHSGIIDRLGELQTEVKEKMLWTREKAFKEYEWLLNVAKSSIEEDQLRKAYADAFVSGLDGMNKMTFANDDLANKKIRKEIEMLDKKIDALEGSDVDTSMMQALVDVIDE